MARFYAFCVLLLVSISSSIGQSPGKRIVVDISDNIDRLTPLLSVIISENGRDPLKLSNIFEYVPLSKVNLTNVYLRGLSKIYRNKPATLSYQNRVLTYSIGWATKNLSLDADYHVTRNTVQTRGRVYSKASPFEVDISINFNIKNSNITVTKFRVGEFKRIETSSFGDDNSSWVKYAVKTAAERVFTEYLRNIGPSKITEVIRDHLDKFELGYINQMLLL